MTFCKAFTSHLMRINSVASQSINSGCEGWSPCDPKLSTVFTKPTPKNISQYRFTATRAVNGLDGSTSHMARPNRFLGAPAGGDGSHAGVPGSTLSPG